MVHGRKCLGTKQILRSNSYCNESSSCLLDAAAGGEELRVGGAVQHVRPAPVVLILGICQVVFCKSRDEDPVLALKTGSGALYLKQMEILKCLLNEYFR